MSWFKKLFKKDEPEQEEVSIKESSKRVERPAGWKESARYIEQGKLISLGISVSPETVSDLEEKLGIKVSADDIKQKADQLLRDLEYESFNFKPVDYMAVLGLIIDRVRLNKKRLERNLLPVSLLEMSVLKQAEQNVLSSGKPASAEALEAESKRLTLKAKKKKIERLCLDQASIQLKKEKELPEGEFPTPEEVTERAKIIWKDYWTKNH